MYFLGNNLLSVSGTVEDKKVILWMFECSGALVNQDKC